MTTGHSQNSQNKKFERKDKPVPCKLYQKDTCSHNKDHETSGQLYLHVCSYCYSQGKSFTHTNTNCKSRAKNVQSTGYSSTNDSTIFVRTRIFFNTQKYTQGTANWKIDYNRVSKTYADIVKSKSSQVYSNGNVTKANNIAQGVNLSVNTKDTQSRVHTHKTKQGVNTQGDDLYDVNIGNIPHVLPVKGHYQKVKTQQFGS